MNKSYVATYKVEGLSRVSIRDVWAWLKSKRTICLDLETTGLDPYTSSIIMLQLGDDTTQFAIDLRCTPKKEVKELLLYIRENNLKVIGQNLKFDWKMICHHFEIRLRNVYDTMTCELVLECGRLKNGFSLEHLTARYLDFRYAKTNQLELFSDNAHVGTLNKFTRKEFVYIGDKPFTYNQLFYGLTDIEFTFKIYLKQITRIASDRLYKTCYLENQFMCVLGEMELNGFYVDPDMWTAQYERNKVLMDKYRTDLLNYILESNIPQFRIFQLTLFDDTKVEDLVDINLASSKQVIELCKALGIPTEVLDKKKSKERDEDVFKDSVEEKHLRKYASKFEIIPIYLEYRRYLKAVTTYGIKFLEDHVNKITGRIHSNFWPVLDTGRIASRGPNLQNIPSEGNFPGFRPCFTSGTFTRLVVTDYSNQEGRTLADLAGELNMINFFNTGDGDLHSHTAKLMFKVPVIKEVKNEEGVVIVEGQNEDLRQLAKILNFGIAYGMSPYKLSNDFGVSLEEAEDFIEKFYQSYPELEKYFKRQTELTLMRGYVLIDEVTWRRSYGGETYEKYLESKSLIDSLKQSNREVPKRLWSEYFTSRGVLQRMSQNYRIQGSAASMTKLAAIRLWQLIDDRKLWSKIKIVNIIHDEIVLEAHEDYIQLACEWVKYSMESAGSLFVRSIKMVADPTVTDSWEHG